LHRNSFDGKYIELGINALLKNGQKKFLFYTGIDIPGKFRWYVSGGV